MPFTGTSIDHLPRPTGSVGPSSSFGENFSAGLDQQYVVDSMYSLEFELLDRYNSNVNRIEELTGEDLSLAEAPNYFGAAARRALGANPQTFSIDPNKLPGFFEKFDEREARIKQLKTQYPEVQTFDEMLAEVQQMRQDVLQQSTELGETAGFFGSLGSFAGSVVGSFSPRDPLLVGSLFMGGWGNTIAKRLLTEAGVASGVEAVQQFGSVQRTYDLLGEEGVNPWLSVAFAGVGAGVIRGGVEIPAPAYRALERRLAPQRALAREFAEGLDGATLDTQLLEEMFGRAPDVASVRAARQAFEIQQMLKQSNPYGLTMPAERAFLRDLDQLEAEFNGLADTRIDLPPQTVTPEFMKAANFDQVRLRAEQPELGRQLDSAEARLTEIDNRIADLTQGVEGRTVGDAVGLVDEIAGARVRAIEEELDTPGANRAALEQEMDMIVESLDPEVIARAEQDFRIGPKRQLQQARKSRQAAKRDYNRVAKEAERALADMKAQDRVRNMMQVIEPLRPLRLISPNDPTPFGRLGRPLSTDRVQELATQVDEVTQFIPEVAEGIVARAAPVVEEPPAPTGAEVLRTWFGASKITDKKGAPRIAYHGTRTDIEEFRVINEDGSVGAYFTTDPDDAANYSLGKPGSREGAVTIPVYLKVENPLIIKGPGFREKVKARLTRKKVDNRAVESAHITPSRFEELQAQGYDGIINERVNEIVVFSPDQIKSIFDREFFDQPRTPPARTTPEQALETTVPEGMLDVGLEAPVRADLTVPIDTDGAGTITTPTVRQILDDLNDDNLMLEAMRTCSI